MPQHVIGGGIEPLPPFGVAMLDRIGGGRFRPAAATADQRQCGTGDAGQAKKAPTIG